MSFVYTGPPGGLLDEAYDDCDDERSPTMKAKLSPGGLSLVKRLWRAGMLMLSGP